MRSLDRAFVWSIGFVGPSRCSVRKALGREIPKRVSRRANEAFCVQSADPRLVWIRVFGRYERHNERRSFCRMLDPVLEVCSQCYQGTSRLESWGPETHRDRKYPSVDSPFRQAKRIGLSIGPKVENHRRQRKKRWTNKRQRIVDIES